MSNIDLFEKDAEALVIKNEDISSVGELARRAKELEKELEELEATMKERKEQQRKLLEESIPAMLQELGMREFKMSDGSQIQVKAFYREPCKGLRVAARQRLRRHHQEHGVSAVWSR